MRQLLAGRIRDGAYRALPSASALLMAAALATACGDRTERTASVDSALARDLTLAGSATATVSIADTAVKPPPAPIVKRKPAVQQNRATSAPQSRSSPPKPTPRPTPRTERPAAAPQPVITAPAPVEPAPTAAPGPAPAARGSIGSGSLLTGTTGAEICSLASKPGDRFVVPLSRTVTGTNGAVLEAGTPVLIELATSGADGFTFRLRGVQVRGEFMSAEGSVAVSDATTSDRAVANGSDKTKVITGAVAGAILGRILGGGAKGTVIGAAAGAGAGTVAAQRSRVNERCMAAGATITVTLSAPLVLPTTAP